MSKPSIVPDKSVAGIAVDPRTLERVIPESRRSDGSVRKQIKIRPGFTPQEDVRRFRGTKQSQMDAIQLPPGHIPGWTPPSSSGAPRVTRTGPNSMLSAATRAAVTSVSGANDKPLSKAAKKNEKRKEKRKEKRAQGGEDVKDNWEDEDGDDKVEPKAEAAATKTTNKGDAVDQVDTTAGDADVDEIPPADADKLTEDLDKLKVT